MHGNRDFLIGARFCAETGCRLVPEGSVIELHGEPVLLLHGDSLCTDDVSYQRLRRIVRNPFVRWLFDRMSLAQRQALAQRLRAGSQEHVGKTAPEIMDVNAAAVAQAFRDAGVRTLIHGHTHRPAVHPLEIEGAPARRIVLGDWYTQGSVLRVSEQGYELEALPR
jgi:UDP-2,3-diacylglucosamine hydrolase